MKGWYDILLNGRPVATIYAENKTEAESEALAKYAARDVTVTVARRIYDE